MLSQFFKILLISIFFLTSVMTSASESSEPKVFSSNHGVVFTKTQTGGLILDECVLQKGMEECQELYRLSPEEASLLVHRHNELQQSVSLQKSVFTGIAVAGGVAVAVGGSAAAFGYYLLYAPTMGMIGAQIVVGSVLIYGGGTLAVAGGVIAGLGIVGRIYQNLRLVDNVDEFFMALENLPEGESIYMDIKQYGTILTYEPTDGRDYEHLISPLERSIPIK